MIALIVNFICRFNKLTERHYEKSPWPEADYVASIVDGGKLSFSLFLMHHFKLQQLRTIIKRTKMNKPFVLKSKRATKQNFYFLTKEFEFQ